jgi:hypothetical protein
MPFKKNKALVLKIFEIVFALGRNSGYMAMQNMSLGVLFQKEDNTFFLSVLTLVLQPFLPLWVLFTSKGTAVCFFCQIFTVLVPGLVG